MVDSGAGGAHYCAHLMGEGLCFLVAPAPLAAASDAASAVPFAVPPAVLHGSHLLDMTLLHCSLYCHFLPPYSAHLDPGCTSLVTPGSLGLPPSPLAQFQQLFLSLLPLCH